MKQNITLLDGALGTALWAKAEAHVFVMLTLLCVNVSI